MKYQVIHVESPNGGVNAAAVLTRDGNWEIYVNTLAPEADRTTDITT